MIMRVLIFVCVLAFEQGVVELAASVYGLGV